MTLGIHTIPLISSSFTQRDSGLNRILFDSFTDLPVKLLAGLLSIDITLSYLPPIITSWMLYCFQHALVHKFLCSLIQLKSGPLQGNFWGQSLHICVPMMVLLALSFPSSSVKLLTSLPFMGWKHEATALLTCSLHKSHWLWQCS